MAKRIPTLKALAARLVTQTPAKWTSTTGAGYRDAYGELWAPGQQGVSAAHQWVRFERVEGDVTAVIVLNITETDKYRQSAAFSGRSVEGHTLVNGGSFTRVGIDCSSCDLVDDPKHHYSHDYGDLITLLACEWDRCVAAVERKKTARPVPGTPFTRQADWFVKATEQLRAGKTVSLAPHGFGTGYTLARKGSRFDKRAPAELEQQLGVTPIYIGTYDAD